MHRQGTVLLLTLTILYISICLAFADASSITVITLDEKGDPIQAQQLEWWYSDLDTTKTIVNCASEACDTWELPTVAISNATISLVALVQHSPDQSCADWYSGTLNANKKIFNASYYEVKLRHTNTACK
jgi:hypothetical protein